MCQRCGNVRSDWEAFHVVGGECGEGSVVVCVVGGLNGCMVE